MRFLKASMAGFLNFATLRSESPPNKCFKNSTNETAT